MNELKKGDIVKIVSIHHTERNFGTNGAMWDLFRTGQYVRIESIDNHDKSVSIKGCYWHQGDIKPVDFKVEKDPQIFHFDDSKLVV
jgi:hypothetical protein